MAQRKKSTEVVHDVVIVGAGLAGLSCARHVARAGRSVVVLESSDGVGGRVRTDSFEGFLLDRGFQVLLTAYPEVQAEVDLVKLDMRYFDPGALVRVGNKNHVVGDPLRQPSTLLPTTFAPIGNVLDKARIALLRYRVQELTAQQILASDDLSTVDALRKAGFSQRIIDTFFRPLVGGIQLDPELATSRRMFDLIFRSLGKGEAGVPASGMGQLSEQLASPLSPGTIHLGSRVVSVAPGVVTLASGDIVRGRAVVVAVEGPAASELTGIPVMKSRPVSCVYFAAPEAPTQKKLIALDGASHGPVLNMAVMSNVSPAYAPPGQHLIAAACPGVTEAENPQLLQDVTTQLRNWWGPTVNDWRHLRTYNIAHGQPDQCPPFSPKKPIALGEGMFVCGDHRDTGSSQGAMYSGRRCAAAVLEHIL